jgi:hypothetical protein
MAIDPTSMLALANATRQDALRRAEARRRLVAARRAAAVQPSGTPTAGRRHRPVRHQLGRALVALGVQLLDPARA